MKLAAFISEDTDGAQAMESELAARVQRGEVKFIDAAGVVRLADGSSQMWQCPSLVGQGTLGGIFWGMFIALVYWSRWWGLNIGSVLSELSMDETFIKEVGQAASKHHSALFLMGEDQTIKNATRDLARYNIQVVQTDLADPDWQHLSRIFRPEG